MIEKEKRNNKIDYDFLILLEKEGISGLDNLVKKHTSYSLYEKVEIGKIASSICLIWDLTKLYFIILLFMCIFIFYEKDKILINYIIDTLPLSIIFLFLICAANYSAYKNATHIIREYNNAPKSLKEKIHKY